MQRPAELRTTLLLLFAALTAFTLLSWRWYHANGYLARPPATEAGVFRVNAASSMVTLEDDGPLAWLVDGYLDGGSHTPGMPMSAALLGVVTGDAISPRVIWITMTVFGVLLGLGTYRLARSFVGPYAAVGVAGLTLVCPVVSAYSRDFFTSLPMVALLIWTLDALVRSRCLATRRGALQVGVLAALATWMKVIAPLYLVGPAFVAVVCGVRRHGGRRVALNVAVGAVPFLVLLGPWIYQNLAAVGDYAQLAVKTDHARDASQGGGLFSLERWTYYPRWAINTGFGFALSVLVVLALARALVRSRSHGAESWIVAASVLVSWVIVTAGQTSGYAQYVMLWVPLGVLLVFQQLSEVRRPTTRRIGVVLLTAVSLWTVYLSQRSLYADGKIVDWNGLYLIGGTHRYLAEWARGLQLNAAPEAEPWPVAEFTDLMLAHAGAETPALGMTHPFVSKNMQYEALLRRREVVEAYVPWRKLLGGTLQAGGLGAMRYMVLDAGLVDPERIGATLRNAGYAFEVLGARRVTPRSSVLLIAVDAI